MVSPHPSHWKETMVYRIGKVGKIGQEDRVDIERGRAGYSGCSVSKIQDTVT